MTVVLKKPAAIFFDWDGTLVYSLPALHSYYNHVMKEMGMPAIDIDTAKRNIRLSARDVFPKIFGERAEHALKVFYDYVADHHLEHVHTYSGSTELLQNLSSLNIPMGVVSNKRHEFLLKEISFLGWDKYFVTAVGAGKALKDKPAAEPLLMAIQNAGLNAPSDKIWYVGDTETDVQTAVAAGCAPIFIEHGLGDKTICLNAGLKPHFIKGYAELRQLVENF